MCYNFAYELDVGKLAVNEVVVDKLAVDELTVDDLLVSYIHVCMQARVNIDTCWCTH